MRRSNDKRVQGWGSRRFDMISRRGWAALRRAVVEAFEDRTLLSGLVVTDTSDSPTDTGSLRYAIALANTLSTPTTITFAPALTAGYPPGLPVTFILDAVGDQTAGPSTFGINADITIEGLTGDNGIVLKGNSSERLFYVGATGNLTLENLTLENGDASGGSTGGAGGGAGLGGAIFNQGTLTVLDSTLTDNAAVGGSGGSGRNIENGGGGLAGGGSSVAGGGPNGGASGANGGFGGGGGPGFGSAGSGGFGGGGGSFVGADGIGTGGGGFGGGGGGYYGVGGFAAGDGGQYGGAGGGMGGAVFNAAGTVTLTDSTLTGNFAEGGFNGAGAGNGSAFGAAVFNLNGTVSMTNDTLANNNLRPGDGGNGGSADGADLYTLGLANVVAYIGGPNIGPADGAASATLTNNIFANGTETTEQNNNVPVTGVSDIFNNNSSTLSTVSGSNNLATQSSGLPAGVTATTAAALNLGTLASNGGPTQTVALGSGSSAIGAGVAVNGITTDQRGDPRPAVANGPIDVGAYQTQTGSSSPPGPVSLSQSTVSLSPSTITSGGTSTVTLTADDASGAQETGGGLTVAFGLGNGTASGTFSAVTDNGNGTYTATFTGTTTGMNTVTATIGGNSVTSAAPTITVTAVTTGAVPPSIGDFGFEQPSTAGTAQSFIAAPIGTAWTFAGHAGVSGNGGGYTAGNPNAPEGVQVGYLQLGDGVISQSLSFASAGTYQLSFSSAQRQNYNHGGQTFLVEVDGVIEGTITPVGTTYANYTSSPFSVGAGSHTISFVATDPLGGDNTAFIDNVQVTTATPTPTPTPTPTSTSASATFLSLDTGTQGNWIGTYGAQGFDIAGVGNTLPSYAVVSQNGIPFTWASSTSDTRAPQNAAGTGRVAAEWYGESTEDFNLNLTDGATHQVALYVLDWDHQNRQESVQVIDANSGTVLATQTVYPFSNGAYLLFNVSGHVIFRFTKVSGGSAAFTGLFLNSTVSPTPTPTPTPTPSPTPTASASFLRVDSSTQGNWMGTYGSTGYVVAGDSVAPTAVSLPNGTLYTNTGSGPFAYPSQTSSPVALQRPNGTGRVASGFYDPSSFDVQLLVPGGATHQVALYLADFDDQNRTETVQVFDSSNNALTPAVSVGSFTNGKYVLFNVEGDVTFRFSHSAGGSAVLSGLFID